MLLLWCTIKARTELICDLKRFYGIDARDVRPHDTDYIAALAYGLMGYCDALVPKKLNDAASWRQGDYLLAEVIDRLNVLAWQNSKDGYAGRNYPTPYPRPGMAGAKVARPRIDANEIKAALAKPRAPLE